MEDDSDTIVNNVVATILQNRVLQGNCIKSGEKSIQNNSLKNLIKLLRAWKNKEFTYVQHGKQYEELWKVGKIIEKESDRTAYDYYQVLRSILLELDIETDSNMSSNRR